MDAIRLDTYDGLSGATPFYEHWGFTKVCHRLYRGAPLVYFELVF